VGGLEQCWIIGRVIAKKVIAKEGLQAFLHAALSAIGSWKVSWTAARNAAQVSCRWHDMRHTFVSTMAEGEASDATIMSLAGHLSRKMMEKYSHTRNEAKRQAIAALDKSLKATQPSKRRVERSPQITHRNSN
jgi:integrase